MDEEKRREEQDPDRDDVRPTDESDESERLDISVNGKSVSRSCPDKLTPLCQL